ncbi:Glycerol-3-phosphate 1-O-acyltransferase [Handroanthus impetiginosus]|uniref:Glycerol-3-phosphate 1-O-acyltransferase n=1 Tax=Handroanthus impetiginosus TaxID=429701 RepID=A0A2G9HKW5_9LAMI|nr:Glycerol-3-phosphate 1-O-acyltransferase [Handroanthus impetiginosus]
MQKYKIMALTKALSFQKLYFFLSILILKHFKTPQKNNRENTNNNNNNAASQFGFHRFQILAQNQDLKDRILIFNVEKALLRSSSLFPYFMLVAFEAGSIIRALILFLLYPFIALLPEDFALKIMVMISFFGLNKERFREGRAVLPKFLLEDVGMESFETLRRGKKAVAVSELPQVMIESFLRDYLDIDCVFGKEMKVFCGYFVGLMEERRELIVQDNVLHVLEMNYDVIGITGFKGSFDYQWFSCCKEIYMVNEQERKNWQQLPRHLYPKPLIFHDGRLAFKPTFLAALAMFMWLPLGVTLGMIRIIVALTLPFEISIPIMHFTGIKIRTLNPPTKRKNNKSKNILYVCNHKTLLDPVAVSYATRSHLTAVTYSLSRMSEIISPIKTIRLSRNRDKDAELMDQLLSQSDAVVCPEGTTCREPYLLRFSPLFSEIRNEVSPVALNCHVSMFYGTTARGMKFMDPLLFLINPWTRYSVCFLDVVRCDKNTRGDYCDYDDNSKFKVANLVQNKMAKALGFTCTKLTRKDKYLILAGNEGIVTHGNAR